MAEVLGLLSSIVLLISATNTAYAAVQDLSRLAARHKSGNSRFETIKWRIYSAKLTTDEWANNVAMNETPIDANRMEKVDEIRLQLVEVSSRVNKLMRDYDGMKSEQTGKRIISQYKWNTVGYEDAKGLADLMEALNKTLVTLVPPLPAYSGAVPQTASTAAQRLEHEVVTAGIGKATASVFCSEIKSLWQACCDAMQTLACQKRSGDMALKAIHKRVRLWGRHLCDSEEHQLDVLLASDARAPLRRLLVSQLVLILVLQEHLLLRWVSGAEGTLQARLETSRTKTRLALIGPNITQLGIEMWYRLQYEEAVDPKSLNYQINHLDSQVEILFSTLPAIRSLRHMDLLESEAANPPKIASSSVVAPPVQTGLSNMESTNNPASGSRIQYAAIGGFDDNLDLIEHNLQKMRVQHIRSPVIEKSRAKLEEWSAEAAYRRDLAVRAEHPEVRKVQEALSMKLDNLQNDKSQISASDMEDLDRLISTASAQLRL